LLVLANASACKVTATFECTSADECRLGTMTGNCEPAGFCSFFDPACPSGYRYDDSAVDPLGNQCVDGVRARRKPITIDGTRVAETCVDFPVWIDLTDAQLAARAQPDGGDLVFTDVNGTAIPYEIQNWDPATGHLGAWIELAQLDPGTATVIYVQYGIARTANPDSKVVFGNGFAAVWHFDDPLSTPAIADATRTHAGTAVGLEPARQVPARLGGGIDFQALNDLIQFVNPLIGAGSHTISAWIDARTATAYNGIVIVGSPLTNQSRWFHTAFMGGVSVGFYGNDWAPAAPTVDGAGWTLLHWVFDGSTRVSRLYRDGVLLGTFTHATGIDTQGAAGYIGYAPGQWGPSLTTPVSLRGTLDEVRIATVARSAGWIATEFANQSSPSTFYTVGDEELAP